KRGGRAQGGDRNHPGTNQLVRQRRQTLDLLVGPAVFDRHVLALDEPRLLQALAECPHAIRVAVGRRGMQEPDCRRSRLLGARRERPRRRRAAEQGDERAAFHWITSSARPRSVGAMSMPIAFSFAWLCGSTWTPASMAPPDKHPLITGENPAADLFTDLFLR